MNMIDYNKVIEALEKERQYLLNREQYGAENVLVKHAINVIHYLPIIRQPEVIRCKDCKYAYLTDDGECKYCEMEKDDNGSLIELYRSWDWFCADGERREET